MNTNFYNLVLKNKQKETSDTSSFTFEIPEEHKKDFEYRQGQYVTLKFNNINNKEVRRAYSMSSSPTENTLTITVKKVEKGLVSNYMIDNLSVGSTVEVMPPAGRFYTPLDAAQRKTYYLFGAGSGITPLFSILKTIAEEEPQSTIFLLYGSRMEENIIFKKQLDALEYRYTGQIFVEHILSQPKREKSGGMFGFLKKDSYAWQGEIGRIDDKSTAKFLEKYPKRTKEVECFICGPSSMIDNVKNVLLKQDIDKKNIHVEHFTNATTTTDNNDNNETSSAISSVLSVLLKGKKHELSLASDKKVLDVLIENKIDAPYSCTSGACSSCMAKIINGAVKMDSCSSLDKEEIEEGYILTCQAHATSKELSITFDF